MPFEIHNANCLDAMRQMPDNSVDAVVTDPPYGLNFMGKKWDYDVPSVEIWAECLRVLKPGGHLLAFAGTRTQHRMAVRIEDAGFEIRDMIAWVYGSGFPKSHNLSGDWQGWGTALKPALEPITVARKPFAGTVSANVLAHGTGAINVDGCRVAGPGGAKWETPRGGIWTTDRDATAKLVQNDQGRWPANLIHDGSEEVAGVFGDPARFFYCAKASKKDRDAGLEQHPLQQTGALSGRVDGSLGASVQGKNNHPTVKPTDLMRYLCRLVTPPGGTVLDPFTGSGSTGRGAVLEGFQFVGCELDSSYADIARARIAAAYDAWLCSL